MRIYPVAAPHADAQVADVTSEALELIKSVAPAYSRWVQDIVGFLIVLKKDSTGSGSRSLDDQRGLIYVSLHRPVAMAEALVHEASHQYLFLLKPVWLRLTTVAILTSTILPSPVETGHWLGFWSAFMPLPTCWLFTTCAMKVD